jgi:DeoR/GlpR family transcriptional regulator of sugar metabolism
LPRRSEIRRQGIVRLARSGGLASVTDLSIRFGVTASTIRRDLALLEDAGQLARTYGGAMALVDHPESSLAQRTAEAPVAKHAIALWAARQIREGETVLLDSGTTAGALAHALRGMDHLTVVTTGLNTLVELSGSKGVHVECLGGTFRPASQGFVGPLAEAALERLTFDRAFLGADSVTAEDGICEADLQQTRLKESMMKRARQNYLLVHAAKLGRRPFHAWTQLPSGSILITDDAAATEALQPFIARGIEVVVVNSSGHAVN